ncbi:uncharacterized protein MYCFIDRAFT_171216 [Pseudocercospora fijiensis CIRAD86]|uniref:Uncharacterized protein n=1 Tax=Pseudocercospora fijiensis (strain CIRAD86) TaxID=383855 RepID=M3A281_PSEFD|nr:uncharacterized protein MYCFIDRAFT_171216 [Pseudocercospora fijiensis CIRAD86]EME85274.1 hypothetical protein MYCFIDRAFT_171216 [Pseudocercospora fijiensis CIRAD86]
MSGVFVLARDCTLVPKWPLVPRDDKAREGSASIPRIGILTPTHYWHDSRFVEAVRTAEALLFDFIIMQTFRGRSVLTSTLVEYKRFSRSCTPFGASIEVAAFGYLADGGGSGHKHMFHHQLQQYAKRAAENNEKPDLEQLLKRTEEDEEIAREYKRQLPDLVSGVLGSLTWSVCPGVRVHHVPDA